MERSQREDSPTGADLERKYIRIQTVGMAFVLSSPVAGILAGMYGLETSIPQIMFLLVYLGIIIFAIGHVGRQELKEGGKGE